MPDTTPPDPPTDILFTNNGATVVGKAEPESRVVVTQPDGSTVAALADANGIFEVQLTFPLQNGELITVVATDPSGNTSAPSQAWAPNSQVPCFAAGTFIMTMLGEVKVETLRAGDQVFTQDRGYQPIRWIGSRKIAFGPETGNAHLKPVRIETGALGANKPVAPLLVSPQHRVLVCSKIAQTMFGATEVLVAAKLLLALDGISLAEDLAEIEYFHILFDHHEVVLSNGTGTESLHPGIEAMKSVGGKAREEILEIFPELKNEGYQRPSARPVLAGKPARKLVDRHAKHGRPVA